MTRDRLLEQAIELLAIADFHSLTLKEERNQVVREGIELLRQPKPDQNELQERVETLYAMYEQVCRQRDELMDVQRSMVEAMRGRMQ